MSSPQSFPSSWRTPALVIVAGCLISVIGFGVRSSFGLYMDPMSTTRGWNRETFSLALALQNLAWGICLPIAGAIADRFGPTVVIAFGALIYALGVFGMANADSASALYLFAGLLTGTGVAFSAFSLAMAAMARVVSIERRSLVLGLGTAAGSLGQVIFSPLGQSFISTYGWQQALLMQIGFLLVLVPLAFVLPGVDKNVSQENNMAVRDQTLGAALSEAMSHRGFVLLTMGFFVCGFHVAFITVHFPSYIKDIGLAAQVGALALSMIGVFNIVGSILSGWIGQRYSKKSSLSFIYIARAVVITGMLVLPKSAATIYLFSALMGLLWLSTVPLTTGIVAQVFGLRYLATLFGVVFLSHQIGSFVGVWMGGRLYDAYGSYDGMWWAGIFFGIVAAVLHWPIDEKPLVRLQTNPAM